MDLVDPLSASSVLRARSVRREIFDADREDHRLSLKHFLTTGSWQGPQFYIEYPCNTVPETVLRKMALKGLELLDDH